jgi:hypothetical protein
MDLLNQAARVSSLARALEGSTDLSPWIPRVGKSSPMKGIETLVVPFQKSGDSSLLTDRTTHNVALPKAGNLMSAFVRLELEGIETTDAAANRVYFARGGLGYALVEQVRLLSNSRELSRMTSQDIKIKVAGLPGEMRDALDRLAGVGLEENAYTQPPIGKDPLRIKKSQVTKRAVIVHCPIPIAMVFPSHNPGSTSLDTAFLEELQIECVLRKGAHAVQKIGTGVTPTKINASLVLNYAQLNDADRQKVIAKAYKAGRPLQLLSTSYEEIGHATFAKPANTAAQVTGNDGDTHKPGEFKFRSSTSSMVRAIHVYVYREDNQTINSNNTAPNEAHYAKWHLTAANNFAPIRRVLHKAGGRTVFDASPEQALSSSIGRGYGASSIADSDEITHFTYRYAADGATDRMSGAAAYAGLSSQEWEVYADLPRAEDATDSSTSGTKRDTAATWRAVAVAEVVKVLSISPSDGSVKVSLST